MRWLFLIVLLLNIVYLLWQTSLPTTASYANVPALKNVQPVVLLAELKSAPLEGAAETRGKPGPVDSEPVNSGRQDESIAAAGDAITGQQNMPVSANDRAAEKSLAVVAVPVPENQSVATSASGPEAQNETCFTLGPFRNLEALRGLTRDIKEYVISADFRGLEEKQQALYWVYIAPKQSREKAIETGRRLKAKKINDFFIIQSGDKQNGLSLGRFKNKSGAYGLAKKVEKLGFAVTVEPIFKTATIYWLDYQQVSGAKIPESIFEKYTRAAARDKVSHLSRQCES